jgi:hypothetical protein
VLRPGAQTAGVRWARDGILALRGAPAGVRGT